MLFDVHLNNSLLLMGYAIDELKETQENTPSHEYPPLLESSLKLVLEKIEAAQKEIIAYVKKN